MSAARNLDDVVLCSEGWEVYAASDFDRSWFDSNRDPVRLRLFQRPCPETTLAGWRSRANAETRAGGGVVVSFDDVEVDGLPAFKAVFKYPASRTVPGTPSDSLAVYIVGMIVVPLGGWFLQVNIEALEHGDTGTREAIYGVTQPRPSSQAPAVVVTADEMFDRFRATLGQVLPSDAEEFDKLAPQHPLSRVRTRQRQVIDSLEIGPGLRSLLD